MAKKNLQRVETINIDYHYSILWPKMYCRCYTILDCLNYDSEIAIYRITYAWQNASLYLHSPRYRLYIRELWTCRSTAVRRLRPHAVLKLQWKAVLWMMPFVRNIRGRAQVRWRSSLLGRRVPAEIKKCIIFRCDVFI